MARGTSVLFLFAITVVGQALTPPTYLTDADRTRMRGLFTGVQPYGSDLESAYYSVMGFALLDEEVPNAQKACEAAKGNMDASNVDSVFYASSIAANLKNCKVTAAQSYLEDAITNGASSLQLYHAVAAMSNLGMKVDVKKVSAALDAALQADDSAISHAYVFYAASYLSGDLKKYHDLIEDIMAQSDEIDDKYAQFEGGLYPTSLVIDGAYRLAATANKAPSFTDVADKVTKFANYFLSRKHVQSLKNAVAVVSAIKTFTTNKFHVPIAVSLASQVAVSDQLPQVKVRVSNLFGQSLGKVSLSADNARHLGTDAVVLSKKPFTVDKTDAALFELDFFKVKPAPGFYKMVLSVTPAQADKRLIGTSAAEVEVKVTTQVAIENVELGVADKEQSNALRSIKVQHPSKAANALEADHHQRITMRFQLRNKALNEVMTAHQAFIRLTNAKSKQEIFFVPETDATATYKFDLDLGERAKDFNSLSGKYTMDLIIGDAIIQNSFFWTVADVQLTFPEGNEDGDVINRYAKKPEIEHQFREPEPRPPKVISTVFTGLVLAPLGILILLWMKLGANISNFPMSVSALGFHIGLAAIFGLYYCYWVHLDMFVTLRYLGILAIPTFLFGNRLLSGIAAKGK